MIVNKEAAHVDFKIKQILKNGKTITDLKSLVEWMTGKDGKM